MYRLQGGGPTCHSGSQRNSQPRGNAPVKGACQFMLSVMVLKCDTCGKEYLDKTNFAGHLLKHTKVPSELSDRDLQYRAIRGDLLHKAEVYDLLQNFGFIAEKYFSNESQAKYLREFRPDLITDPGYSDHTLGTIFEDNYFRSILFRSHYLIHVADRERMTALNSETNPNYTRLDLRVILSGGSNTLLLDRS